MTVCISTCASNNDDISGNVVITRTCADTPDYSRGYNERIERFQGGFRVDLRFLDFSLDAE